MNERPDTERISTLKLWQIDDAIHDALVMREDEEEFDESYIEALELAFESKVSGCAAVSESLKEEIKTLQEIKRKVTARIESLTKNNEGLKEYIKSCLKSQGMTHAGSGMLRVRIQNNPMSVAIADENVPNLPSAFQKVTIEARKADIIRHVKETGEIPEGVEIVYGDHVRVY